MCSVPDMIQEETCLNMTLLSPPCVSLMLKVLDKLLLGVAFHAYSYELSNVARQFSAYIFGPLHVHFRKMMSE